MSGAGKSQVVSALEDIGYFCADNVPPRLLGKFAELSAESGGGIASIALVVDVRSRDMFSDLPRCLEELKANAFSFQTIFLDCGDATLQRRFKETRRRHPLLGDAAPALENAIRLEREMLAGVKARANFVIDTSLLSAAQLRTRVRDLFVTGLRQSMVVQCISFGFKYGLPVDSDLVFDVRCLPNPFYEESLRERTGLDEAVRNYVLGGPETQGLLPRLLSLIDYLLPLYRQEGKSQLVLSFGCTGGRHRSVVFTELLAAHLTEKGFPASVTHRDISVTGRG